jgi:hypothetical protein
VRPSSHELLDSLAPVIERSLEDLLYKRVRKPFLGTLDICDQSCVPVVYLYSASP